MEDGEIPMAKMILAKTKHLHLIKGRNMKKIILILSLAMMFSCEDENDNDSGSGSNATLLGKWKMQTARVTWIIQVGHLCRPLVFLNPWNSNRMVR